MTYLHNLTSGQPLPRERAPAVMDRSCLQRAAGQPLAAPAFRSHRQQNSSVLKIARRPVQQRGPKQPAHVTCSLNNTAGSTLGERWRHQCVWMGAHLRSRRLLAGLGASPYLPMHMGLPSRARAGSACIASRPCLRCSQARYACGERHAAHGHPEQGAHGRGHAAAAQGASGSGLGWAWRSKCRGSAGWGLQERHLEALRQLLAGRRLW
jgi:hypothetical protein